MPILPSWKTALYHEPGDFSVLYRASGWLKEASLLVSTR